MQQCCFGVQSTPNREYATIPDLNSELQHFFLPCSSLLQLKLIYWHHPCHSLPQGRFYTLWTALFVRVKSAYFKARRYANKHTDNKKKKLLVQTYIRSMHMWCNVIVLFTSPRKVFRSDSLLIKKQDSLESSPTAWPFQISASALDQLAFMCTIFGCIKPVQPLLSTKKWLEKMLKWRVLPKSKEHKSEV